MIDRHLNILIVEDTQSDYDLLISQLSSNDFDFDPHHITNGEELEAVLSGGEIDLVISDFNLPSFDGLEALRLVRAYDPMIPFILLSGTVKPEQETEILELGASEVISKANLNRLPFTVRRVLYDYENKKQLKLLESVVTNTNDAVMILEAEPDELPGRKIVYVNNALTEMTGYAPHEIVGNTTNILNGPKTDGEKLKELGRAMDRWKPYKVEIINYRKNGEEFWVSVYVNPVEDSRGGYSHWICIERDITKRINREQKIRRSLREKEILLAEIHHRVKNNLAVVSSMLQLERSRNESFDVQQILLKAELRIKSMANIHENLYKAENFAEVSVKSYFTEIIKSINDSYNSQSNNIKLESEVEDFAINVNQAIPLGLILNELLTNIYKHAFTSTENENKSGRAFIKARERRGKILFTVRDNGRGLPNDIALEELDSLGFTLIITLVKQLRGKFETDNRDGFYFHLEFEKKDKKGSVTAFDYGE